MKKKEDNGRCSIRWGRSSLVAFFEMYEQGRGIIPARDNNINRRCYYESRARRESDS